MYYNSYSGVGGFGGYESDTFMDDFYWSVGFGLGVVYDGVDSTFSGGYLIYYIKDKYKGYGYI